MTVCLARKREKLKPAYPKEYAGFLRFEKTDFRVLFEIKQIDFFIPS